MAWLVGNPFGNQQGAIPRVGQCDWVGELERSWKRRVFSAAYPEDENSAGRATCGLGDRGIHLVYRTQGDCVEAVISRHSLGAVGPDLGCQP